MSLFNLSVGAAFLPLLCHPFSFCSVVFFFCHRALFHVVSISGVLSVSGLQIDMVSNCEGGDGRARSEGGENKC